MLEPDPLAKCYKENGGAPLLKADVIKSYLPDGYYDNPAIAEYEKLEKKSWCVAVDDDLISLMDTYYTELMGED